MSDDTIEILRIGLDFSVGVVGIGLAVMVLGWVCRWIRIKFLNGED
jgi:hypothetical protein